MLREAAIDDDEIDLSNIAMSHYRLTKIKQQDLRLEADEAEGLYPANDLGSAKPKDKMEEFLSQIINRLNDLFAADGLSEGDMVNYARTIAGKVQENRRVIKQMENNTPEQAMLGDFPRAVDDAILESSDAHQKQMLGLLSDPQKALLFKSIIFDLLSADSADIGLK